MLTTGRRQHGIHGEKCQESRAIRRSDQAETYDLQNHCRDSNHEQ